MVISLNQDALYEIQDRIDHQFKNQKLLIQAFTRKSYGVEHGCADSEILEFLGDAVLEKVVTDIILSEYGENYYSHPNSNYTRSTLAFCNLNNSSEKEFTVMPGINEGFLTEKRKQFVNGKTLAKCIDDLHFSKYLRLGRGDLKNHVEKQASVKEDLFEAILGAVAVDSDNDYVELEKVVRNMMDVQYFLDSDSDNDDSYYDLIQHWYQKEYGEVAQYSVSEYFGNQYEATLRFEITDNYFHYFKEFRGCGISKREAKENAAHEAYDWLDDNDRLFSEYDIVTEDTLTPENAINKLQELHQQGYCSEPVYEFSDAEYEDGRAFWPCICMVKDWNENADESWSSKKASKKYAAFALLCNHFGWDDLYEETVRKRSSED